MSKKSKKRSNQAKGAFSWLVTLLPALIAAFTAFWNTSMAREQGFAGGDRRSNGNGSKKTRRSKRASAAS